MKKYALTKNAYQKENKRKLKPDEEAIYREACINYYAFKNSAGFSIKLILIF